LRRSYQISSSGFSGKINKPAPSLWVLSPSIILTTLSTASSNALISALVISATSPTYSCPTTHPLTRQGDADALFQAEYLGIRWRLSRKRHVISIGTCPTVMLPFFLKARARLLVSVFIARRLTRGTANVPSIIGAKQRKSLAP
jgi:hypothetical protein